MCRCHICDSDLTEKEVDFDDRGGTLTLEPCTTCLDIIMSAAYCSSFPKYDDVEFQVEEEFDSYEGEQLWQH